MDSSLYEKLLNAGFRYASFRPHSEREMRDFLQKTLKRWKTAGSVTVEKVMNRLRDYGHVDDKKFAHWWVEQRSLFRPKGKIAIRMELQKKGIPRSIIDEETIDEQTNARKAIQKKIIKWAQLPIIEQKKKMYTFLAQRGFASDTIEKIIDETVKKDYN